MAAHNDPATFRVDPGSTISPNPWPPPWPNKPSPEAWAGPHSQHPENNPPNSHSESPWNSTNESGSAPQPKANAPQTSSAKPSNTTSEPPPKGVRGTSPDVSGTTVSQVAHANWTHPLRGPGPDPPLPRGLRPLGAVPCVLGIARGRGGCCPQAERLTTGGSFYRGIQGATRFIRADLRRCHLGRHQMPAEASPDARSLVLSASRRGVTRCPWITSCTHRPVVDNS